MKRGIFFAALSWGLTLVSIIILMMRIFYPNHRIIAIIIYLVSWIPFFYMTKNPIVFSTKRKKSLLLKYWKPFLIISSIVIIVGILITIFPIMSFKMLQEDKEILKERMNSQQIYTEEYIKKLKESEEEFIKEIENVSLNSLESEKKQIIKEKWRDYLSYFVALQEIIEENKYFYQINYFKERELNEQAFTLGYSSLLASYSSAVSLMNLTYNIEFLPTLLNEEDLKNEIPKDSYLKIEGIIYNPASLIQINAGYTYLKTIKQENLQNLKKESEEDFNFIMLNAGQTAEFSFKGAMDFFEKNTFKSWFPVQKKAAEKIGDTKIPLRDFSLIKKQNLEEIEGNIQPGDVLLQRRNWQLSNVGLPGFWKHTAIYVGNLSLLDEYFEETIKTANTTNNLPVSEYLKSNFPSLYEKLSDGELRTIEAEGEGVLSLTLEESMSADYAAVLRPKLSKEQKLQALSYLFAQYGKPYDFNFDFITDNTLVCSELYYKAYPQLNYILKIVSGRLVLSTNHIVQEFDENYEMQKEKIELIYFIDGNEKEETAFLSNLSEFKESWKRTETDIIRTLI